jgi:ABC-type transporter Mla subunit MlaD
MQAQALSDESTKKALEEAVGRMTDLLEKQEKNRNGATTDALMQAFKDLRGDLDKKFTELTSAIRDSSSTMREDIAKANSEGLKAEIAGLRADLEAKTVAAGTANTEALQAQLAKMEEMMAKGGGGGGGFGGDVNDLLSKLEGSMSKKLAEAGIGKAEVSAEESVSVSSVMLGAAFKGMDDIESNIGALDAKKSTDKEGGKKAKGALDALRKLKGK